MAVVKNSPVHGMVPMTAEGVSDTRNMLSSLDLPVQWMVISQDVYTRIIGHKWFQQCFDPHTEMNGLKIGDFGSLFGMTTVCDAFYHPEERILGHDDKNVLAVVSVTEARGTRVYRTRFYDDDDE